jgi:hypothetical protein
MMRQPFSTETKPFKQHLIKHNVIINAVDYDLGRNGIAYFDKDTADYHVSTGQRGAGNKGRVYRNDGVDISRDSLKYESYYVSSIEPGEWLQYTVDVKKAGNYTLKLNIASNDDKGKISVGLNGKTVAKEIRLPNTGGLKTFQPAELRNIPFKAGKQVLRILADTGYFNFNYIQFVEY